MHIGVCFGHRRPELQFEGVVARAGMLRRASDASSVYVERVIGGSSVDPAPITELAALYREARFSVHEFSDEHRDTASRAVDRVVIALRSRDEASA